MWLLGTVGEYLEVDKTAYLEQFVSRECTVDREGTARGVESPPSAGVDLVRPNVSSQAFHHNVFPSLLAPHFLIQILCHGSVLTREVPIEMRPPNFPDQLFWNTMIPIELSEHRSPLPTLRS